MKFALLFLLLALIPAAPLYAQNQNSPVSLVPKSRWVLDYGESRCRIIREFVSGASDETTLLYFEQTHPTEPWTWLVAGPHIPNRLKVSVQFGPENEPFEVVKGIVRFGGYDRAILGSGLVRVSKDDMEDDEATGSPNNVGGGIIARTMDGIDGVRWLEVEPGTKRAFRVPLDDMLAIGKAMTTCMEDLIRSWGLDPAHQATVATSPKWINPYDVAERIQQHYPAKAFRKGQQAELQIRVMVEASGELSKCVRTDLTRAEDFDSTACVEIMKWGEFEPARDGDGNPMRSYFFTKIRYLIP